MKRRKRTAIAVGIYICSMILLTGCGREIPDMTEEQRMLISEYAAGLLLKYDANYQSRLVDVDEQAEIETEQEQPSEEEKEPEEIQEDPIAGTEVIDKSQEAVEPETQSISRFYGMEGIDITYQDYQILYSYPEAGEEEVFFAMDATEGNKLLILKFVAANISGEERELDMFSQMPRFRVSVNDEAAQNILTTMLLNDLAMYKGTIGAGESLELVLVTEIPEDMDENIHSLTLTMRSESGSGTTLLK